MSYRPKNQFNVKGPVAKRNHIRSKISDLSEAFRQVLRTGIDCVRNPATMLGGSRASQLNRARRQRTKSFDNQ